YSCFCQTPCSESAPDGSPAKAVMLNPQMRRAQVICRALSDVMILSPPRTFLQSERLGMTAQLQFPTPGARWLRQRSHVGPRDRPRREHVKSLAALNDTAVDDEMHNVNPL